VSVPAVKATGDRLARTATEVFAPAVLAAVLLLVVGWQAGVRSGASRWWGLPGAVFAAAIPLGYVLRGVRRGRYSDHHIAVRQQRRVPLLIAIGSITAGVVTLLAVGAPRDVVALLAAGAAGLAATIVVTHWWKISIHAAVAAGTVAVLTAVYGPRALAASPLVPLIGWARIRLRAHTTAQVVVGSVLGALVAGAVFPALR
jgi:membrane-associated phospholipid phosphatase